MIAVAKKPKSEKRRAVTVRLSDDLVTDAESFAEKHHRSFTSIVEIAIAEYLRRYGKVPTIEESIED